MKQLSDRMNRALPAVVEEAFLDHGCINITVVAERIRRDNEADNVALEDIEYALLRHGRANNLAMEFDSPPPSRTQLLGPDAAIGVPPVRLTRRR